MAAPNIPQLSGVSMLVISEAREGEITLSAAATDELQVIITDRAVKKCIKK